MPSELTKLNRFKKNAEGVYCAVGEAVDFDYSDGSEAEQRLHEILSQSTDLQSDSAELNAQIVDWPTEYHLSSVRANLLRCLDLSEVSRVLELGCGCGSISRYLGEQSQLEIDAIEGSPIRAALAALRCKDLDNVTVSCGNFNEIEFAADYYDLILFVGVTEYAGRFSERDTDQAALQDLLALAKKTNKADGVTLIAIENRTGLKYMLGASEDHYGVPYIGLQDYPDSTGIRTYTKNQWKAQAKQANYESMQFLYPFPDYKIPTLILHDRVLSDKTSQKSVLNKLSEIKSRDYLKPFTPSEQEPNLWHGLLEAGTLAQHANSFLLLLGDDLGRIKKMSDFDIEAFENTIFAPRYASDHIPLNDANNELTLNKKNKQILAKERTILAKERTILAKERRINELQNQLDLIQQSRSWRYLESLRPLLKKLRMGRKQ